MPDYRLAADRAARRWNVDPRIFKAMIQQESGFREGVKSPAGAEDIAQFMPGTAKQYGVTLGDGRVADDLDGAAHYLADNLRKTNGNYHEALSIYNSGRPDAYKDPHFAGGQTYDYVKNILAMAGQGGAPAPRGGGATGGVGGFNTRTTTFDQAGFEKARKLAVLGNYLQKQDPNNPLLRLGVATPGLPDPSDFTHTKLTGHITSLGYSPTTAGLVSTLTQRANKIDELHLPYRYGGGHASRVRPGDKVPLDCSGAVSSVLGINPRVASQFKSFGKPGQGRVTIWAKDSHVLMEINGHFFGTSASNPGGGAGWIPRSQISPQYLKGFVARHIDG